MSIVLNSFTPFIFSILSLAFSLSVKGFSSSISSKFSNFFIVSGIFSISFSFSFSELNFPPVINLNLNDS
jgi:hypothetical protein